jgi:hypothetical protein
MDAAFPPPIVSAVFEPTNIAKRGRQSTESKKAGRLGGWEAGRLGG